MPSKNLRVVNDDKKKDKNTVKRNPFTYGGSIALLVLIIAAFVWMPSRGGFFSGKNPYTFGYYKGKPIEFVVDNYLHKRYLAYDRYAQQQGQNGIDPNNPYMQRQFWYQAYQDTVVHMAMLDRAASKKMAISTSQVNEHIRQNELRYMENNEFSPNLFQQTARTKQNEIFKEHQEQLLANETEENYLYNSRISTAERNYLDNIAKTEKQFEIVAYRLSDYPDVEVVKYGNENNDLFRKVSLSRITIRSDKNLADDIYSQLSENSRLFEDLAKQYSDDEMYKENGGKMGWVYQYELDTISENDVELLMNLQKDEISPLIENEYGWSIYRCDESSRNADLTSAEDIEKVRYYLNFQASGQIEDYFINIANELREDAIKTSLDSAAARKGKTVITSAFFPVTYGNINVQSFRGAQPMFKSPGVTGGADNVLLSAQTNQSFLEELNSIKTGEISEPLISGQYVMLATLEDTRELAQEDLGFQAPSNFLSFLTQQYYRDDLYTYIMESDDLNDNFQSAISLILSQENGL